MKSNKRDVPKAMAHKSLDLVKRYWWVGVLIPSFVLLALIIKLSVHVPFWDQWEMVPLFQKQANGTLGYTDFWAQHNEHRILFPNVLTYLIAQLTHWDPYYESLVNVLLGFGILSFILLLVRQTFNKDNTWRMLVSIFAAWLILSPIQWENWLWGWQIEWYMSVMAIVGTIWVLSSKKPNLTTLLLALLGAVIATYSLANGIVVWGIGLAILLFRKYDKKFQIAWLLTGLLTVGMYYRSYVNPAYHPSKTLFLHQPKEFVHYVLTYIGAPLTYRQGQARYVGLAILLLLAACIIFLWVNRRKEMFTSLLPWLALASYSLAGAVLTAVSRLGFGVSQSYASRYTTVSMFLILATFVLSIKCLQIVLKGKYFNQQQKVILTSVVMVIFFGPMMFNYLKGVKSMVRHNDHLRRARQCAIIAKSEENPCLGLLYPNNKVVWERLQYLRSIHWGGF